MEMYIDYQLVASEKIKNVEGISSLCNGVIQENNNHPDHQTDNNPISTHSAKTTLLLFKNYYFSSIFYKFYENANFIVTMYFKSI